MPYEPIAKGEKKFAAVQPTEFTKDPAGNKPESGPDIFTGANTKTVDRKKTRLGKSADQKIDYEKAEVAAESEQIKEENMENATDHSDIITLILDKKPLEVEESFAAKLQERVSNLVADVKIELAKSYFNTKGQ